MHVRQNRVKHHEEDDAENEPARSGNPSHLPDSSAFSMAGMSSDHTEAAIITPAANLRSTRWAIALLRLRNKNTADAPSVVMRNVNSVPHAAHSKACCTRAPFDKPFQHREKIRDRTRAVNRSARVHEKRPGEPGLLKRDDARLTRAPSCRRAGRVLYTRPAYSWLSS